MGRPKGSKNKMPSVFKDRLLDFLTDNLDVFIEAWQSLPPNSPAKLNAYLQVAKLVVPPPRDPDEVVNEEAEAIKKSIEDLKRLERVRNEQQD